jgi:hypothetical protein
MIYLRKDVILFRKKLTMFRIHIRNEMIEKYIYIYISIFQYRITIFLNHRSWDSFERLNIHCFNEFHFDNLIFNVSTTHIYYSSIIMFFYNCSYCDSTNKINRELERHLMTCEIRLNIKRRKIFKRIITISKDINVDDARDYFMIDDIQNQNKNDDFTNVFELSNENVFVSTNLNDDIYDLFKLQIELSIHSTTSTFRIQTYEEEIHRRIKICIFFNEILAISQDYQFRNESDQTDEFFSFNNFVDYDLILWFQKIDCTKKKRDELFQERTIKIVSNKSRTIEIISQKIEF